MLNKVFKYIDRTVEITVVIIFILLVIVGSMQVFNRFVLNQSLSWSEELQKYAHIWLVFLTIPIAYRRGSHLGMQVLTKKFSLKIQHALAIFNYILWLILAALLMYYTTVIMKVTRFQSSPGLGIRMDYIYLGLLLGSTYLFIVVLRNMLNSFFILKNDKSKGEE